MEYVHKKDLLYLFSKSPLTFAFGYNFSMIGKKEVKIMSGRLWSNVVIDYHRGKDSHRQFHHPYLFIFC